MKRFLVLLILAAVLAGCSAARIRSQLDESVDSYNKSLRLLDWETAGLFTAGPISEEFKKRAQASADVQMVDCRVVNTVYDAEKRDAVVDVEIEYYKNFSPVVKTLLDRQKWKYLDEKGTKGWRLTSLIPEFR